MKAYVIQRKSDGKYWGSGSWYKDLMRAIPWETWAGCELACGHNEVTIRIEETITRTICPVKRSKPCT